MTLITSKSVVDKQIRHICTAVSRCCSTFTLHFLGFDLFSIDQNFNKSTPFFIIL